MEERIGLGIGAGTERTCGKLFIFGLAVIAFATTHGSQRGVQFAPKRSDHIHHNIQVRVIPNDPNRYIGDYEDKNSGESTQDYSYETIYRCGWCGNVVDFDGREFDHSTRKFRIENLEKFSGTVTQERVHGECCRHKQQQ